MYVSFIEKFIYGVFCAFIAILSWFVKGDAWGYVTIAFMGFIVSHVVFRCVLRYLNRDWRIW